MNKICLFIILVFLCFTSAFAKDFLDKKVDNELDRIIQSKNRYLNDAKIVVPIISQGDPIGSITILPKEHAALGDTELKIAEVGASFLAKQMES